MKVLETVPDSVLVGMVYGAASILIDTNTRAARRKFDSLRPIRRAQELARKGLPEGLDRKGLEQQARYFLYQAHQAVNARGLPSRGVQGKVSPRRVHPVRPPHRHPHGGGGVQ